MSGNLDTVLQKTVEFAATLVPMAILWTTVVCLFALLYVGFERFVLGSTTRYRPGMPSLFLLVAGGIATVIYGRQWLDAMDAPVDFLSGHYSVAARFFMGAAIAFDIGAVRVLCSEVRDEADGPPTK